MSFKGIYTNVKKALIRFPARLEVFKTSIAEERAIFRKRNIYRSIHWTKEQQEEFDTFWVRFYGKKIPNKWHRLYQACSGTFAVDYVPEKLYTTIIEPKLNDYVYAGVLEDKSFIETISQDCGCVVPETIIVCSNGEYFNAERRPITKETAISLLKGKEFVIKPTIGTGSGHGVTFVGKKESDNDQVIRKIVIAQGRDFIAQSIIQEHPKYAAFNPTSINTIRITTFVVNGEIHHIPLAFRIGRKDERLDNIHAGGIGVGVRDDGVLLSTAFELGYGDHTTQHLEHPDSHILFEGQQLPGIPEIIEAAYRVHGRLPHIGIVSWDFTVDKTEKPVLIEANILQQGIWFPQMIHGKGPFGDYTQAILMRMEK